MGKNYGAAVIFNVSQISMDKTIQPTFEVSSTLVLFYTLAAALFVYLSKTKNAKKEDEDEITSSAICRKKGDPKEEEIDTS